MTQALTSAESRALKLLGDGINPATVAASVGLSESRISQLLSDPEFQEQVVTLRYQALVKHNERDAALDSLEDTLIAKLKDLSSFLIRPMEVARVLSIVNAAKRRGASAPDSITQKQEVINLTLPVQIINQFKLNSAGQVIEAGQQSLITVQSAALTDLVTQARKQANHVLESNSPATSGP